MAETKADDDDELGGFASFSNQPIHVNLINGRNSSSPDKNNDDNDDDEWGDFVEYPLRSSGLSNAQSPVSTSAPAKPIDPFGFFPSDQSKKEPAQPGSVETSRVESEKNAQWARLKGALPLSFFGEEDEEKEEESRGGDPRVGDSTDSFGGKNVGDRLKNGSNRNLSVGFSDITNLFNQTQQTKAENGLISHSNQMNLNGSGSILSPTGLVSLSDSVTGNKDLDFFTSMNNQSQPVQNGNEFKANSNGSHLNLNASNTKEETVGENEEFDADDDRWEFKEAHLEWRIGDENNKPQENLASEASGSKLQSTIGQEMQVDQNVPESSGVNAYSAGAGSGPYGSIDLFGFSNGFAGASNEMDIQFGLKPSTVVQSGSVTNSHPSGELCDAKNGLNSQTVVKCDDSDETFGMFRAAFVETGLNQKVGNNSLGSIDLFAASNGFSSKSHELGAGSDFKSGTVAQNGLISDFHFRSEQNEAENGLNSHPFIESSNDEEDFGEFRAAFPENGSKQEGTETRSEHRKGPLPLSIFGDDELETDTSSNIQDFLMHQPVSSPRNVQTRASNISVHDLISNLYSQAEQIPSVDSLHKSTENGLDSANEVSISDVLEGSDVLDDGSWDFQDAISQTRDENQTTLPSVGDAHRNSSSKLNVDNFVDFYLTLKDDLCSVARCHLDNLEKAESAAAISGEDAKVAGMAEEIQDVFKELHQPNISSAEVNLEDHPPGAINLTKFLEFLLEPKFQVLESEFHLSRRLISAESDLRSVLELLKHATTMLNILTLGSLEGQLHYVSVWSKIISICAQELKHGAWIWEQSLEKNVQSRIASELKGKRFIIALGEIYRVVVVLEASLKLYKPWTLSVSVDSAGIYALLEECHTLWSCSGLKESLSSISDPIGFEYNTTVESLLDSIKYINNLDSLALGNHVFSEQEPLCQLSLLTPGVVSGMKMVAWNGEHYFLTLANLWANLISCDPPKLPHLRRG